MFNRRDLVRRGGFMAMLGAVGGGVRKLAATPLELGANLYRSIGVRPIINARGTFTIITGSQTLPEVKKAMEEASRNFVQMDELAEGVGRRLAELTGAEWGMVSAGCAAGLKHVTAACVAGGNPEKLIRIPDLTGFDKIEVVIPRSSRSVYDHAVRNIGVKIIVVDAAAENLTIPNVHLQRGATVVAYSGGKAIRGPQCSGLLLGRKDILLSAWQASA